MYKIKNDYRVSFGNTLIMKLKAMTFMTKTNVFTAASCSVESNFGTTQASKYENETLTFNEKCSFLQVAKVCTGGGVN